MRSAMKPSMAELRQTAFASALWFVLVTLLVGAQAPAAVPANNQHPQDNEYGVDISFPIHHAKVSTNFAWLPHNVDPANNPTPAQYRGMPIQPLGDKQGEYERFMKGCHDHYGKRGHMCDSTEADRVAMVLRQPTSMQNYTDVGFKKIRCPEAVFKLLKEFWDRNKDQQKPENWSAGNTYTNHWESPTHMISVEDVKLRGGGSRLKQQIWDAARDTIQEWTGEELTQCSLYGIRVYQDGAVLAPHVDRLPLVSSAIVNVAQDVDEPWPLEVYAHDGTAYNVTMEPGDMVLYESHSVVHGRPFPLKGRFYANVFIHFEPVGHSLRHAEMEAGGVDVHEKYKESVAKGFGGHENEIDGLPPYIRPDSPEANRWRQQHPQGYKGPTTTTSFETGSTEAHTAAQSGNLFKLKKIAEKDIKLLHKEDANGWQPLHEGARAGHLPVVEYLVKSGVDVNKRTNRGLGGTALYWAKESHGHDHGVVKLLKSLGALDIGPEL